MDLTFRLPGPWGSGKGANLQPTEVDNNFWSLAEAIVDLQSNPAQPVGISSISVSGTQMTITLTDGSTMGPFTLPVLTFRWRGEWEPLATYAELDVFTALNVGIFMAVLDHTSGATFDPDIAVGGVPALQQLFGSADASLSALPDVLLTTLQVDDFLTWDGTYWINTALGTIVYQDADDVLITGGAITGMPTPINPADVATKAYVDALPGGATAAPLTLMSNITPSPAPAIPNTLTAYLDAVFAAPPRGTLLYRGGAGWLPLAPGTSGYFLKTLGAGADPAWAVGGSGVTSVAAGAGITTGAGPITATGSVALASVADNSLLANITGSLAAPAAATLTAFLDHVASSTRGAILTRAGSGWVALAPGTSGYYLQTQGSTADAVWSAPSGSGTVTSISAGTGISTGGAPITGAGTVSLATIATASVLANISGSAAAPVPATVSVPFDLVFGATQGSVLYRNASTWVVLTPGTSGQVLTTGGASANPAWANAASGGPIANLLLLANISGGTAAPSGNSLSNIFDAILGSSRGMLVYRGTGGWVALSPGTSGDVLTTGGAAGDPHWAAGGASISVSDTAPAGASPGDAWWDSAGGQLYIRYNDGTSSQWVPASNQPGPAGSNANITGMTAGQIPIAATATSIASSIALPLSVSNGGTGVAASASAPWVEISGDTMTGALTVNANVAASNYVIGSQATNVAGTVGFTNANGPAVIFNGTTSAGTGQLAFVAPIGVSITMDQTGKVFFEHEIRLNAGSQITPSSDNSCYCGSPTLAWFQVNSHNYGTISDPEKKTDIAPVEGALAHVMAIAPMSFRWKSDPEEAPLHWGFMVPDVAREMGPDFAGAELRPDGHSTLLYNDLTAVLWRAVQELSAKVAALEGKPA